MKNIFKKIINIIFFIIWIFLTIYIFLILNISFSLISSTWSNFNYFDIVIILAYYIPFILWLIILYIFWKNIHKKRISVKYYYSYIIFLIIFILYYIFVFNNAKVEYIEKESFQTINHNKEFTNQENAYDLINDFNPQFRYDIQNINIYCLREDICSIKEKETTLEQSDDYIKNNFDTYLEYRKLLFNITQKSYIKRPGDFEKFLSITGLISTLKFQIIIDKQYLENNQFDEIIEYYEDNYKLSNMLLESDNWVVSLIIWTTIRSTILDNFKYLLNNNSLSDTQLAKIKNLVWKYKIKESYLIFENTIKSEYLSFFNPNVKINNSLIFNNEEFLNFRRYVLQKQFINLEELSFSNSRLPVTQIGIYYLLYSDINYLNYKEDLLKLIERELEFVKNVKLIIN